MRRSPRLRVRRHPEFLQLIGLWELAVLRGHHFRLCERKFKCEDVKIGDPVYRCKRIPYRIRVELYALDVVQSALEVWRLAGGNKVDKRDLPYSPWQCAAEMGIGKTVVDEVLAAALQDGTYDRALRELILKALSLHEIYNEVNRPEDETAES